MPALEFWAGYWADWVSAIFLRGYFEAVHNSRLYPANDAQIRPLLDAFLFERALEETAAELTDRPEWVRIPARAILSLLESPPA
jgi:maltose alpha-D-glucosyltransferase/alpha-amylase